MLGHCSRLQEDLQSLFPSFCISVAVQEGSKEQEGWSLLGDVLLEQELIS